MEENRINEIGKMNLPDMVCNILKAIGSCCSFTAPIVSLLSDFQNHKQNLLIEDVLKTAFAMIDELDNRVRNMEYINSQEFICDLLRTVDYSKDEIDENKRIMYAKYLTACCHIDNAENRCKRMFLELMEKIDGLDFYILKSLKNTVDGKNAIERIYSKYNDEYNSDVSKKEVMNHFYYLTSLGLIEMSDQEEVEAFLQKYKECLSSSTFRKAHLYQRTTLGDDLYHFISKIDMSSCSKAD